jgi:DNA repair protein RadD
MTRQLRPQQNGLVADIDVAIVEGCRRIMAQLPTGGGKTVVASHLLNRLAHGQRGLFTVPRTVLIGQTVARFYENGLRDVGVVWARHAANYERSVQVASVQTLQNREIPSFDLAIIDEAHLRFKFIDSLLKDPRWANAVIIGMSATPWSRGLGKYYDKLIVGATTRELIDAGYLSKFRVFAPSSPDLTGVRVERGDYREDDLSEVMNKAKLVADVVDTWIDRAENRPTLCFAVDRPHAKHLQNKFIEVGVPTGYIDCYTTQDERAEIEQQFHCGEIKVVCNVNVLTTGVDWANVSCLILARPTKSEMLFVQMAGRGLRTADGKADCLILDHSDNHARLGFVTDIHHDELDDGQERQKGDSKEKTALPKKCPKCAFLRPPKILTCPCCGFVPEPQCKVVNREGELVEFVARQQAKPTSNADQIQFYRELKLYAERRGYKSGWVAHKYKEKFGHWPPREFEILNPLPPSRLTLNWIKSRQIAYAKAVKGAAWR